jgi:hypothetical protein
MIAHLLLVLFAGASARSVQSTDSLDQGANPIRKIVTLLQDMQKEVEADGAKDKELYDKFMCFCSGGAEELAKTSADAGSQAESLASKAEEEKAEKAGLEGDLAKHQTDRTTATSDLAKATAIRGKESSEYDADIADQKTNYDAISGAIPALETGMGGASAFLQAPGNKQNLKRAVDMSQTISGFEKKDMTAFLEAKDGYAPQSGQIVGILKNMKDEMESTIKSTETAEEEAVKGFAELKAAKDKEIELASEAIEVKTKRVGELAVSIVQAEDGAEDAAKEKATADKTLATLDETCKTKQTEYAARSKTRSEEVSAISEAISILNDDDALDVFKKAGASSLMQVTSKGRKFGFLQGNAATPRRLRKAQGIIASAAQFHRSHKLSFLSYTMQKQLRSGGAVDFTAITKMIEDMIGVLTAEQADDTKHKTWCGGELASSADESAANAGKIASLESTIAETTDEVASLGEDIAALTAAIAGLDKDVATSTEQRKEEHAAYLETVSLTEAAIQLIGKAKNRLQKFYNPALYKEAPKKELSAEDAIVSKLSFVQTSTVKIAEAPEMPSGPYPALAQKSAGVLALMDMLAGELKTSLGEAEHDEKTAQGDYLELMSESQESRAADTKTITDKSAAKADLEGKVVALKESHHLTLEEAQNIAGYIAELHGSCDFILDNFQLRADARTNEIESLKNAKAVLAGASYSF